MKKRRFRLGVEFTEVIEACISSILAGPTRYQQVGEGVRIFRVKRFPYYIYYKFYEDRDHVRIAAVAHNKRFPDYWRGRLSDPA